MPGSKQKSRNDMKFQHFDLKGHFGSQAPALQPTAETFALISSAIREYKQRQAAAEAERGSVAADRKKAA